MVNDQDVQRLVIVTQVMSYSSVCIIFSLILYLMFKDWFIGASKFVFLLSNL